MVIERSFLGQIHIQTWNFFLVFLEINLAIDIIKIDNIIKMRAINIVHYFNEKQSLFDSDILT